MKSQKALFLLLLVSSGGYALGGEPFSFHAVQDQALALSKTPYQAPPTSLPPELNVSYPEMRALEWNDVFSLWPDSKYTIRFFHRTDAFPAPVKIYDQRDAGPNNSISPVPYSEKYFNFGKDVLNKVLPPDLGYTGFQISDNPKTSYDTFGTKLPRDFVSFIGASYFRAVGGNREYGLSARGISINSAIYGLTEEFPNFTTFWIKHPKSTDKIFTVYALLDGPSVTGAYQFDIQYTDQTSMTIHSSLYFRKAVDHLGIAPLTSMFWFGKSSLSHEGDYRPGVHDSDGTLVNLSTGETIWRPLRHTDQPLTSSFPDTNPRGFGLLQRDHDFQNYEDLWSRYHLRPSAWITPIGDWGKGAVTTIKLPTNSEYQDNVVFYWKPDHIPQPGDQMDFNYRLQWLDQYPAGPLAQCIDTAFDYPTALKHSIHALLNFKGDILDHFTSDDPPQPCITVNGVPQNTPCEVVKNPFKHCWRVNFAVTNYQEAPLELRCVLKSQGKVISETWAYTWLPEDNKLAN